MHPGYGGYPYYSPIRIDDFSPLGTGGSLLQIEYFNAAYAQGVQGFSETVRVLVRARDYMVVLREAGNEVSKEELRTGVIGRMSHNWLEHHFRGLLSNKPPTKSEESEAEMKSYLDRVILRK